MIAVNDDPRSAMVCLFKTLRGYVGGNVEPVDFAASASTCDENLAALGFRRVTDWQAVPDQPRAVWAETAPLLADRGMAATMARVTGSVAATYTVERRLADGTLRTESVDEYRREEVQ